MGESSDMELTWSKNNTPFAGLEKVAVSHATVVCIECEASIRVESKDGSIVIPAEFHDQHLPHGRWFNIEIGE